MKPTRVPLVALALFALGVVGAPNLGAQTPRPPQDTLARLMIESSPPATLVIDDSVMGTTPQRSVLVRAGVHTIRLERDGYSPYETKIAIQAGEILRLTEIVLPQKPKSGS